MNTTIRLESTPSRIVSLVPSQTELLHYLGLDEKVVGITKFCIYPTVWYRSKPRVGGTKSVNMDIIRELKPDLIIGNKEENSQEDIEVLRSFAPVWMSDIYTLNDAQEMITLLGELTKTQAKATHLNDEITRAFSGLKSDKIYQLVRGKSALYFIWNEPDMIAGPETFIDDMMRHCGLVNIREDARYPLATHDEIPDFVLLSSEPYPFREEHIERFRSYYPEAKIYLVNGEMFSWYGSRLREAPEYFRQLLNQLAIQ